MDDLKADDPATPTAQRCITSYPVRRKFSPGAMFPPQTSRVKGAIDLHCHAHDGGNDALALACCASECGMGGVVIKTIGRFGMHEGDYQPTWYTAKLRDALDRWCSENEVAPTRIWTGYVIGQDNRPPSLEHLRSSIEAGVEAVWLPVANNANTLSKVGGKVVWWDPTADRKAHTEPLEWPEALERGYFLLDDRGQLKTDYADIIRMVADLGLPLFYGHGTHPEIFAVAELLDRIGYRRAVIDHPFSPFINLSVPQMKQLAATGNTLNFTYDELSPLLGVDPARMYAAIREVGVEHCTLSSDAGEPLFPHSVECVRLVRDYMSAFGMSADELDALCVLNPARVMGLPVAVVQELRSIAGAA